MRVNIGLPGDAVIGRVGEVVGLEALLVVLASGAGLARLRDLARLSGGTDEAIRRWL